VRRTVWLLDFDGVINAQRPPWSAAPHTRTVHVYSHGLGESWRLRWAPALLERIRAVAALPHVEVRWSSTWCTPDGSGQPAVRILETALALPRWECAFTAVSGPGQSAYGAAKLRAARRVLAEGDDLIWTDDEWVPDESHPLREELTRDGRALLIRPRGSRGLSRGEMGLIELRVGLGAPA
jgi:hypothetical protein